MNDAPEPQFEDVADVVRYQRHQLSRRSLVGGGAAFGLAGLLGACSGKGGSYSDKPAKPAASMQVQINKANIPVPREQSVIVAQVEYTVFDSWNGLIPNGFPVSAGFESVAREAMFYLNLATGELMPWLATGYKYNADHTELTMSFDPKAKWSDGEPFTSTDFKFTVDLLRTRKDLLGGGGDLGDFVKSVETPDEHTALIKMNKPTPRLHYGFIAAIATGQDVLPEHIWRGKDPTRFKDNPPVRTGPYVLYKAIRNQKMFVWKKNPDYWNKDKLDPAPEYVIYQSTSKQADQAALAFERCEFDVGSIDAEHAKQLTNRGYPAMITTQFHDPNPRALWLNNDPARGIIADPKMHWAINYLLDRDKIGTAIWPVKVPGAIYPWADYPGNDKWKNDDLAKKYEFTFDRAKATEILDEIAPKGGDGKRTYQGKPIRSLEIITPSLPDGAEFAIGRLLRDELAKVGVPATVRSLSGSVHDEKFQRGEYDIDSFWVGFAFDPEQLYTDWESSKAQPVGKNAVDKNKMRFKDPKLDVLSKQLSQLDPNSEQAKPLLDQALEIYFQKLPVIPTIQTGYPQFFNTTFWTGWPTDDDLYQVPLNWWSHFIFVIGKLKATGTKAPS